MVAVKVCQQQWRFIAIWDYKCIAYCLWSRCHLKLDHSSSAKYTRQRSVPLISWESTVLAMWSPYETWFMMGWEQCNPQNRGILLNRFHCSEAVEHKLHHQGIVMVENIVIWSSTSSLNVWKLKLHHQCKSSGSKNMTWSCLMSVKLWKHKIWGEIVSPV